MQTARKGGLVISCNSAQETSRFKEIVNNKLGHKYDLKQLTSLNPRLRVIGYTEKLEKDELRDYLKHGNKNLFSENSVCDVIYTKHLYKNKNVYMTVIQVDIESYYKITEAGKMFVGFDFCRVYDGLDVRRCYHCCGFHHFAKQCTKDSPVCPRCSQPHNLKECTATEFKCVHCYNLRSKLNNDISVDHAVWGPACQVYKEVLSKFKTNILGPQ